MWSERSSTSYIPLGRTGNVGTNPVGNRDESDKASLVFINRALCTAYASARLIEATKTARMYVEVRVTETCHESIGIHFQTNRKRMWYSVPGTSLGDEDR